MKSNDFPSPCWDSSQFTFVPSACISRPFLFFHSGRLNTTLTTMLSIPLTNTRCSGGVGTCTMYQGDHCLYFTDGETEAQAGQITSASVIALDSSKSHIWGRCQAGLVCLQVLRSPLYRMLFLRTEDRERAKLTNLITWILLARVPPEWHLDPEEKEQKGLTL